MTAGTILIVDHETDLANSFARAFGAAGYDCIVAYDIDAALALVDSKRPDLVLSEIKFPTGDGFEIARRVRRNSPNTRVVMMTAIDSANLEKEARRAGAVGYLRKPLSNARLISSIQSFLSWDRL